MMEEQYYNLLYTTLLANCPVDTGNMITNIRQEDMGDYYVITISAPKKTKTGDYNYAKDVNYNKQRSAKEVRNFKWVERTIQQVSEIIGEVQNELS
jgi:hypothetical protein